MAENETPILDLDVFAPVTTKRVKIGGQEYGVIDPLDLRYEDYLQLISIEERMKGLPEAEQLGVIRDQIAKCIPDLPRGVIETLPLRQIAWLSDFIQRTVHAPKGGTDPLGTTVQPN